MSNNRNSNIPKGYILKRLYDRNNQPFDVLVRDSTNNHPQSKKTLVFRGIGLGFKIFLYGILVIPPMFAAVSLVALGLSLQAPIMVIVGSLIIVPILGVLIFKNKISRYIKGKVKSAYTRGRAKK